MFQLIFNFFYNLPHNIKLGFRDITYSYTNVYKVESELLKIPIHYKAIKYTAYFIFFMLSFTFFISSLDVIDGIIKNPINYIISIDYSKIFDITYIVLFTAQLLFTYLFIDFFLLSLFKKRMSITKNITNFLVKKPIIVKETSVQKLLNNYKASNTISDQLRVKKYKFKLIEYVLLMEILFFYFCFISFVLSFYLNTFSSFFDNKGVESYISIQLTLLFSSLGFMPLVISFFKNLLIEDIKHLLLKYLADKGIIIRAKALHNFHENGELKGKLVTIYLTDNLYKNNHIL